MAIFDPRGANPSTTAPDYGGSGTVGDKYAIDTGDCNTSTELHPNDYNFIADQLRNAVRLTGVDTSDENDVQMLFRAIQYGGMVCRSKLDTDGITPAAGVPSAYIDDTVTPRTLNIWSCSDGSYATLEFNGVAETPWKATVRVIAKGQTTLSGTQSIDGVALASGDRVLVAGQTVASQNGIYIVSAGAWERAEDLNELGEAEGAVVLVQEGATCADTLWKQNSDGVTPGTNDQSWSQIFADERAHACFSETGLSSPPTSKLASFLVDDVTDPDNPVLYFWSCATDTDSDGNTGEYIAVSGTATTPAAPPQTLATDSEVLSNQNSGSVSTGAMSIGAADADRKVIVAIAAYRPGTNTGNPTVTVGGVPATRVAQYSSSLSAAAAYLAVYIADVPTGTSAVVAINGSSMRHVGVQTAAVTGLTSSTPHDTDSTEQAHPSSNSSITNSLNVPANGYVVSIGAGTDATGITPANVQYSTLNTSFSTTFSDFRTLWAGFSNSFPAATPGTIQQNGLPNGNSFSQIAVSFE